MAKALDCIFHGQVFEDVGRLPVALDTEPPASEPEQVRRRQDVNVGVDSVRRMNIEPDKVVAHGAHIQDRLN